jgi:HlyD family secretion protein
MKKIVVILGILIACAIGAVFFVQRSRASKQEPDFKFEVLKRGDIKNVVSSTGTLSAVGTVAVGSQISGTVEKVLVDYNAKVKKGQLLAVVDKTMLEASVRDTEASVAKSQAQLNQAQTEYQRNDKLFQGGYVSEMDFLSAKTSVETAKAALTSAQAALQRAQTNLKYAEIRSPIAGTVIERTIDAGQTIAASMNAPTLFTIAEDLARMQIEASVDESDIGQIKEGMSVNFTVQAYPDQKFTGTVRQIRLKPTTVQDVVNYTVVVDAANAQGVLLPGMTATVEFLVQERKDVLLVSNTALSFQPSQEILDTLKSSSSGRTPDTQGNSSGRPRPAANEGRTRPDGQMAAGEQMTPGAATKMARVFYLDETGKPNMARFVPGATDGSKTEIAQSTKLQEGVRVITGMNTSQKSATTNGSAGLRIPGMGPGGPR